MSLAFSCAPSEFEEAKQVWDDLKDEVTSSEAYEIVTKNLGERTGD